jgi:hypothetical protein
MEEFSSRKYLQPGRFGTLRKEKLPYRIMGIMFGIEIY